MPARHGPPRAPSRLDRGRSLLVVIDVQERLAPHVLDHPAIVARVGALLTAAGRLGVPSFATEHLPERVGPTIPGLRGRFAPDAIYSKTRFCAADHPPFVAMLAATGRTQVVLCGMEAHVCVMQTALGLAAAGYEVFMVDDASGSRPPRQDDRRDAFQRVRDAGGVVAGTETVLFEWVGSGDDPAFRDVLGLVKSLP